eukprot:UN07217
MNTDDLQLPYLTASQYQNLPSWLLQPPNPYYTPSTTTNSASPQQMNIDSGEHTIIDNNNNSSVSSAKLIPNTH